MIGTLRGQRPTPQRKGITLMNHMKRILALTLALGASLLAGCSSGDSSSAAASSSAASSAAEVEPMDLTGVTDPYLATAGIAADTVMASVDGVDITADHVLYWLNYGVELYVGQTSVPDESLIDWEMDHEGIPLSEALMNSALETSAFYQLVAKKAGEAGLTVPQDQMDLLQADIAAGIADLGSEEAMEHMMWYQMSTLDHYTDTLESTLLYAALQEHYFGEGGALYPTDAEVKAYAEEEQGAYRAKHILLLTKDMTQKVTNEDGSFAGYADLDEDTVAAKKALADDIVAQLKAADDPIALFDQLMHEHSEDTGLPYYPDGYDTYKGKMVAAFEDTALALKEGEISGVVESPDYGYHIILRLPINLDSFREDYAAQRMVELSDEWLANTPAEGNELCKELDLTEFRSKVLSLQAAVAAEMEAIEAAKAEAEGSASASSSNAG